MWRPINLEIALISTYTSYHQRPIQHNYHTLPQAGTCLTPPDSADTGPGVWEHSRWGPGPGARAGPGGRPRSSGLRSSASAWSRWRTENRPLGTLNSREILKKCVTKQTHCFIVYNRSLPVKQRPMTHQDCMRSLKIFSPRSLTRSKLWSLSTTSVMVIWKQIVLVLGQIY